MAEGQLRRVVKIIGITDDKDIKRMANSLDSVTKSAKKVEQGFTSLKNIAYGVAGGSIFGFGARELSGIADGMIQLNSKLNIFVGEGEKASKAFKDIAQIATDTRAPIADIATIFTRIATATQRLNLSTELQLGLTRILQQSFKVSGATAEEATASTIQFAQALSFGQLRGQELRSVLSQNSVLATVFGRAIEGSGKDIYKFAEAGGFTTKFVLKALFDNMKNIDDMAQKIAPTFEQTMTRAMNEFTIAVKNVNEKFNLNQNFAKMMDWILNNGDKIIQIIVSLAATAIPALITKVISLNYAMLANPYVLFAAGIGGATYAIIEFSGGIEQAINNMKRMWSYFEEFSIKIMNPVLYLSAMLPLLDKDPEARGILKRVEDLKKLRVELELTNKYMGISSKGSLSIFDEMSLMKGGGTDFDSEIKKLKDPLKSLEEQIGAINVALNGAKSKSEAAGFIKELQRLETLKIDESMKKGTYSLVKYHEELSKNRVEIFALQMEHGILTIEEFNKKINEFKIGELDRKFKASKITLEQYTEQMRKLRIEGMDQDSVMTGMAKGADAYLSSVKNMSDQVGSLVEGVFGKMEDAIFESTKGATRSFADMTQAILDDITRMAIRMAIIQPLSGMMSNFFNPATVSTGAAISGSASGATMGGGFGANLQLAKGGVLDGPSFFGMGQGKMGVAGEAGPEAVLPLKRSADGVLGVRAAPTTINIINNGSNEVTTQEKTGPDGSKIIDVMIQAKVREGITNGAFDRQLKQSFALTRKGV